MLLLFKLESKSILERKFEFSFKSHLLKLYTIVYSEEELNFEFVNLKKNLNEGDDYQVLKLGILKSNV